MNHVQSYRQFMETIVMHNFTMNKLPNDKSLAEQIANEYLKKNLGLGYHADNGFSANSYWYFLIKYRSEDDKSWSGYGKLAVESHNANAVPLTPEQIDDIRELTQERMGETDGVSRLTAKQKMKGYLTDQLSLFIVPGRPTFINQGIPIWRAFFSLEMPLKEPLLSLGTIDVYAHTGEVIPLTQQQVIAVRNRVNNAATHHTSASAATG